MFIDSHTQMLQNEQENTLITLKVKSYLRLAPLCSKFPDVLKSADAARPYAGLSTIALPQELADLK